MLKIVVPISGGKDSQACLKLALETHSPDEVRGLFCDTQFEHPLTYAHIDWMASRYGVQIDRVCAGSVEQQINKHRRFPGGGARFCTEELKIVPSKKYYKALADSLGHGFEVWYGMRSDESSERSKRYAGRVCDEVYPPHEILPGKYPQYLHKAGVSFRLAILDWPTHAVYDYLAGEENPLYKAGFDRVGCFPCLAGGDAWKEKAFHFDETGRKHFAIVKALEPVVGRSVYSSKRMLAKEAMKEAQGCLICSI
jgi:3'-phosphoadenosine 5'-phosphosulfate sulfotransferase (PAPS reductase)/FAD synthetase